MFRTRKAKKRSHTFCWFCCVCVCVCVFHCQSVPTLALSNPQKKSHTHKVVLDEPRRTQCIKAKHARTPRSNQSPERAYHCVVASSVASCAGAVPCALSSFNPLHRGLLQFQFCKLSLYFDLLTRRRDFADIYCCHLLWQGCVSCALYRKQHYVRGIRNVYCKEARNAKWRQPGTVITRGGTFWNRNSSSNIFCLSFL